MDYRINPRTKKGWIELITGCMFAGKTEEFIKRISIHKRAQQNVIVFKPLIDNRYSENDVQSHSGLKVEAISISKSDEIKKIIQEKCKEQEIDVVGIDEVQFIDTGIQQIAEDLASKGIIVIVNGLDKDFKSDPFQNVDYFLVQAEYVDKLSSICRVCGGNANKTQRIVDGKPSKANEPIVLVSGNDHYEARCRHCYIKPK